MFCDSHAGHKPYHCGLGQKNLPLPWGARLCSLPDGRCGWRSWKSRTLRSGKSVADAQFIATQKYHHGAADCRGEAAVVRYSVIGYRY